MQKLASTLLFQVYQCRENMNIFVFALVATFIGAQVFALTDKDIKKNIKICNVISGVDKKLVKDVLENGKVADDPILKKDMVCFFRAIKVMDKKGNLDKDKLLEYFKVGKTDQQAQELLQKCGKEKDTPGNTAREIIKCKIDYEKKKM